MPSVRPESAHVHPVRKTRSVARPRAAVFRSDGRRSVVEMIAELLKDREPPDANELRCFDLIRRFHRWGRRDSCQGLRLVAEPFANSDGKPCLPLDGRPTVRRHVLELACFWYRTGPQWNVVSWGIDEEAIHFQPFPSEKAARLAFR